MATSATVGTDSDSACERHRVDEEDQARAALFRSALALAEVAEVSAAKRVRCVRSLCHHFASGTVLETGHWAHRTR